MVDCVWNAILPLEVNPRWKVHQLVLQKKHNISATINNRQCDNDNRKEYKYVRIITNQQDTKSNPNPNQNPNPTTKQHTIVNIRLNIVACLMYPEKFIRDDVVAAFLHRDG